LITVFETNIKQHFVEYVEAYVNAFWRKDELIEKIKKLRETKHERESAIKKLVHTLRHVKSDILNVGGESMSSYPSYHAWVKQAKGIILPDKIKYEKVFLLYELQCSLSEYFAPMMRMTESIEGVGKKIRNVCPLRMNIIPKHITIDTTTLIHLLFTNEMGAKSKLLAKGKLVRKKKEIWDMFLTTNKKAFKARDYVFNHMIDTDGVAFSILLIKRDMEGKRMNRKKYKVGREPYIDGLTSSEKESLLAYKVVGIDPNMGNLLFCVNEKDNKTSFRYTQNQRRQETKVKK